MRVCVYLYKIIKCAVQITSIKLCDKSFKTCLFLIYVGTIESKMRDREIFIMSARLIAVKLLKIPFMYHNIYLSK